MPNPPIDGGAQVMHFTTRGLLANNVDVKTLAINPTRSYVNLDSIPKEYVVSTRFECVTVDTNINPARLISNTLRSESYFIERFISSNFEKKLKSILQTECFDIIQLEHLYLCKYINTIKNNSTAKIILRPQNIEYIIWERYINNVNNPIKKIALRIATNRLKKYEQKIGSELDGVIALTKEDADIFKSFNNNAPIIIIPMGYDYEKLNNYNFEKQFDHAPIVYHLGSMDWLPNVEAVEWFLKNVIPLLEKKQFNGKIIIAGRKMPKWVFQHRSKIVDIIGEVNSPVEFQEEKQIMIVPLLSGSGIRAKIIEGLALGKTIIATTIGAQGIDYENGKNILIADTPDEFANQIIKCVNSKEFCMTTSKNARQLSMKNYHYNISAKNMIDFYHTLLGIGNI